MPFIQGVWGVGMGVRRMLALLWLAAGGAAGSILMTRYAVGFGWFWGVVSGAPLGAALAMLLHWAPGALRHGLRHRLRRHRFLCPSCLEFGPMRFACGGCRDELDSLHFQTGRVYSYDWDAMDWPHNGCGPGITRDGIAAYCRSCQSVSDRRVYHERRVRVLGALSAGGFEELRRLAGAPSGEHGGIRHFCKDDGHRLTYVVDLSRLPGTDGPLSPAHLLGAVEGIWLGTDTEDVLGLAQNADRFLRLARLPEGRRGEVRVCAERAALGAGVQRVLEGRFGPLEYGVTPEAFLRLRRERPAGRRHGPPAVEAEPEGRRPEQERRAR